MRKAMEKWLQKRQIAFDANTARSICDSLGLDGEKVDECLGLCYQLEKGDINEAELIVGLALLTGKKPEEVVEVLRGMEAKPTGDVAPRVLVETPPEGFYKRESYGSQSGAYQFRRNFLKVNPRVSPADVVIFFNPKGFMGANWEVWIRKEFKR